MAVVVTGAAGFVGAYVVRALRAAGRAVVGIDRRYGTDLLAVDLAPLLADAEAVIHLAGESGVRASFGARRALYVRNNVDATARLLAACPAGTPVVHASSSSVYGDAATPTHEDAPLAPISPYAETKLAGERLALDAGAVVLRLFTVYGPGQRADMAFARFCRALSEGRPVSVLGDGRQTRDFTYVGDVAAAFLAALSVPGGQAINVGGGSAATVLDAIGLLGAAAGIAPAIEFARAARGDVRDTRADVSRAAAVLGWTPAVSLADGLALQWASYTARSRAATAAGAVSSLAFASAESPASASP